MRRDVSAQPRVELAPRAVPGNRGRGCARRARSLAEQFKFCRGRHEELLERQLKPEARTDAVTELAKLEVVPTAMIDISDGLASEALHIAAQSGCGVKLYEDKIPMSEKMYDTARAFHLDPTMCALSGGEDYELLFTVPQECFEDIQNHPMFSIIGHLTEDAGERTLVTRNGMETELLAQGWDGLQGDS